jgi:hypothetical protein
VWKIANGDHSEAGERRRHGGDAGSNSIPGRPLKDDPKVWMKPDAAEGFVLAPIGAALAPILPLMALCSPR